VEENRVRDNAGPLFGEDADSLFGQVHSPAVTGHATTSVVGDDLDSVFGDFDESSTSASGSKAITQHGEWQADANLRHGLDIDSERSLEEELEAAFDTDSAEEDSDGDDSEDEASDCDDSEDEDEDCDDSDEEDSDQHDNQDIDFEKALRLSSRPSWRWMTSQLLPSTTTARVKLVRSRLLMCSWFS
jgi:hypothetical protein